MSQVKKLATGGTASLGSFRMNGRELDGQLAIDRLAAVYRDLPQNERGMFSVAQRAILDGNTAEYDPTNNTIKVLDKDGNNITFDYTDTKARTTNSWFKKKIGATFKDEAHRFKTSGEAMAMVNMLPDEAKKETPTNLTELMRGSGWFAYDKNDDGTFTYRAQSPTNFKNKTILENIRTYLNDPDQDTLKDRYSTKGWTEADLSTLRSFYNGLGEDKDKYYTDLYSAIENNKLSDAQKEFLYLQGFSDEEVAEMLKSASTKEGELEIDPSWKGNRDALKAAGIGITLGPDGRYHVIGDNEFTRDKYWNLSGQDWVKGTEFDEGFLIDGMLFTPEEASRPGQYQNDFRDWWAAANSDHADYRSQYTALNKTKWRFKNDNKNGERGEDYYGAFSNRWNPSIDFSPNWSDHRINEQWGALDNTNVDYNILTGAYEGIPENTEIIAYADTSRRNKAGIFKPKYWVRTKGYAPDGHIVYNSRAYLSEDDMVRAMHLTPSTFPVSKSFGEKRPWQEITVPGKKYAVYQEFGKPGQKNTIYIGNDGRFYLAQKDASGNLREPAEILNAPLLLSILKNPDQELTNEQISSLKKNPVKEKKRKEEGRKEVTQPYLYHGLHMKQGGYIPEQVYAACIEDIDPDTFDYNSIKAFQFGGPLDFVSSAEVQGGAVSESEADISKDHELKNLFDWNGADGGLTPEEKTQIYAAMGDIVGAGLAFVPGLNVASAAVGAASSIARYTADRKQHGPRTADKLRLAGNLGLDVLTLVPVVGGFAKSFKIVKAIRAVGKPLLKAMAIANVGNAIYTSAKKLITGEKWTSQDLTNVLTGLSSGVLVGAGITKRIAASKLAAKTAEKKLLKETQNLKMAKEVKEGDLTLKKTPEEISTLLKGKTTESQAVEAMQSLVKQEQNVEINADQAKSLLKKFNVTFDPGSKKFSWKIWKKPTRRESTTNTSNLETETTPQSAAYYFFNSAARAKQLGSEAVYGSWAGRPNGKGNWFTSRFRQKGNLDVWDPRVLNRAYTSRGRLGAFSTSPLAAINRIALRTPEAFGNAYVTENGVRGPISGYNLIGKYRTTSSRPARKERWVSGWVPGWNMTARSPIMPKVSPKPDLHPVVIKQPIPGPKVVPPSPAPAPTPIQINPYRYIGRPTLTLPQRPGTLSLPSAQRLALPGPRSPFIEGNGFVLYPQGVSVGDNFIMYRKGGKIIKAQNGLNTFQFGYDPNNIKLNLNLNNKTPFAYTGVVSGGPSFNTVLNSKYPTLNSGNLQFNTINTNSNPNLALTKDVVTGKSVRNPYYNGSTFSQLSNKAQQAINSNKLNLQLDPTFTKTDFTVKPNLGKFVISGGAEIQKNPITNQLVFIDKGPIKAQWASPTSNTSAYTTDMFTGEKMLNPSYKYKIDWNTVGATNKETGSHKEIGVGGDKETPLGINWPNLDDTMNAIWSIKRNNKYFDKMQKGNADLLDRQFIAPRYNRYRIDLSEINRAYDNAQKSLNEHKIVSSSLRDTLAQNLALGYKKAELEEQRGGQQSKYLDTINAKNNAIANTQAKEDAAMFNAKSQHVTGVNSLINKTEGARIQNNWQIGAALSQQLRQQGREAWERMAQAKYQADQAAATKAEATRQNAKAVQAPEYSIWSQMTPAEKNRYGDFATYILQTKGEDRYKELFTPSKIFTEAQMDNIRNYNKQTGPMIFYKKGGSNNARPMMEQIGINAEKESKRAALELSKHLMKMFEQLLK